MNFKHLFLALTLVLVALAPNRTGAAPIYGVKYGVHNFSVSTPGQYDAVSETEICIFCHTPHGGTLDGPLWNRVMDDTDLNPDGANIAAAGYFTHYNSATLGSSAGDGSRPVSAESLVCMSCHDGSVAINRVINISNSTAPDATYPDDAIDFSMDWQPVLPMFWPPAPGPAIGLDAGKYALGDETKGQLQDDHPVSFSYTAAYSEDTNGLNLIDDAKTAGVRFFGTDSRVECSSCHDPHVDYGIAGSTSPYVGLPIATDYKPFLLVPVVNSELCLACHNK